jgi:hypothetical protein
MTGHRTDGLTDWVTDSETEVLYGGLNVYCFQRNRFLLNRSMRISCRTHRYSTIFTRTSHQFTGIPILSLIYRAHNLFPISFTLLLTRFQYFFLIKPTRCTNFTNLFWHEAVHVSDFKQNGISSTKTKPLFYYPFPLDIHLVFTSGNGL